MPRATRYLQNGFIYHLTHRCHDGEFFLRFAKERDRYREWLRVGALRYEVAVAGQRKRYRIINQDRLLCRTGFADMAEFSRFYVAGIQGRLDQGRLSKQPCWTEAVAIGSEEFVHEARKSCSYRRSMESCQVQLSGGESAWLMRESRASYSAVSPSESPG